tara:strand:+ start:354 stop:668 length:315 start_codon:yes stop_codon:yes gene_type:complete
LGCVLPIDIIIKTKKPAKIWLLYFYRLFGLYLLEKRNHNTVENNKMNPPANVVTKEVFKPSNKICGAIFEILGTIFQALLIPTAVEVMPNIAVSEPTNMILSIW